MAKLQASHAMDWVDTDQHISSVVLTAHRLLALENTIRKHLPAALRKAFGAAQLAGTEVTLLVDHAAMAAKIRQMQPRLVQELQGAGWQIQSIKIRVASQPRTPPAVQTQKVAKPLDSEDLTHFKALATSLRKGPLADAVNRLLTHHQATKQSN